MKKGRIQSNVNGAYEDIAVQKNNQYEEPAPQTYADMTDRLSSTSPDVSSPAAQARTGTETRALNLQLFAEAPVDMNRIADITDPAKPKYLFTTMGEASEEDDSGNGDAADNDVDAEEYVPDDPVLFARLAITDQNLPHTAVGEAVVRSTDGELHTVAVEKDGTVTDSSFQIGADNLEEGCIPGSKLEESTITSRELNMTEIFADATLLNQTLAENLDTEGLFNNDSFLARFDERVAGKAVLKAGDTMTGPLVLTSDPADDFNAVTKQYVDTAISGEMPGNAATATALQEAKTISLDGKVTGTATAFDGTKDIAINATQVDATTFCGKDLSFFATQADQGTVEAAVAEHVANRNNPHAVTKAQVGLSSVNNYGIATQAEAEAATVNTTYMTPLRTAQAIASLRPEAAVTAHMANRDNPHAVTKAQVGLSSVNNYGIATQAEAEAGTVSTTYMTPLRTAQAIAAGKAASATKLATARAINGKNFDGTGDITTSMPLVIGTQTATTATWTGNASTIDALYDGLQIQYYLPFAGSGNATLNLTLKDGSTTGAINCYYRNATALTTHMPQYALMVLTYRPSLGTATGAGWWLTHAYYTDTYNRTNYNIATRTAVATYRYKLLAEGMTGSNFYPFFLTDKTDAATVAGSWSIAATEFRIDSPILYYNSTTNLAAAATFTAGDITQNIDIRYNINVASLTNYAPVLLKGKIGSNGGFVLDQTSYYAQAFPTTDDGYVYWYLGYMYSTTAMRLTVNHPVYYFKNGKLRVYTGFNVATASDYGYAMASSATPLVAGTAALGTDNGKYAREGHVHPVQTTVSGNAGTATVLATGRTVQTDLASTTAVSFNGSANITPGVTGILPITNGGTGATTAAAARVNLGIADDKNLPLAGGIMSGSISFDGELNKGDWASRLGDVDQPIDNSGLASSVISGSVGGKRLYSLEMLNATGSPVMRLYAGTNYLEVNGSNITTNGVIYNAAWNDYAEYFPADRQYAAGQVVRTTDHGLVTMSTGRLQRACHIVSGTYGMILGDEKNGVPVALAGRVLAYVDNANLKTGDAVCSGKEGTVSRMRWYERVLFPDRMIGIVHYVPTSDKWNNYDALGRVVISVK